MYYNRNLIAFVPFAFFLLAGCQQRNKTADTAQRTAVLRFENLSGSPSEDWQGRALSELLMRRFGGNRLPRAISPSPGISTERLAAIAAGADRLIVGYFTYTAGTMTATAFAEDVATRKLTGPIRATGSVVVVAESLAKQLGGLKPPALDANSAALKEYSLARDTPGPAALQHYDLALQADANFGPAYLGALQTALGSSDVPRAEALLASASAHSSGFSNEDRAYLQLQSATLARDASARLKALSELAGIDGQDVETLRTLADSEMSTRQPAEAARHYRQLIANTPLDPNLQNLLAYASLFAGDEAGARAAAAEYKQLRPQDPNSFDTQGDIELATGHFAEAEKIYLASPDGAFQDFSPTWKAAHARLLSGDVAGATGIFEKHKALLAGSALGAAAVSYRAALWQYETGQTDRATRAMAAFATSAAPAWRAVAYSQAAIWAVVAHDNQQAVQWSELALRSGQTQVVAYAAVARFLAQPPTTPDGWTKRAEATFSGPNGAEVRRLAVGYALLLAKQMPEASAIWKQIFETTNVNDSGPAYLYGWTLLETGHAAQAAPLLKLYPIPPPGITPTFEALYLAHRAEWRERTLRQ